MASGDPESIRDFKNSGDLLKCIHNNGVKSLSVVVIYSIVGSIIHVFSSSFMPFDPKEFFTIIESFRFSKNRLMLLIFSTRVFL